MPDAAPMPPDRNPISKALQVLAWLVEAPSDQIGVRELAAGVGISPASAHRLLGALAAEGFARQDKATARYAIGLEMTRLAQRVVARTPVRLAALPPMRSLVAECNETALLGLYDPQRRLMMFAASVESTHSLRYAVELDRWAPLHAGASGLAILAFLPAADVAAVIAASGLAPLTGQTITDPARLAEALQIIRRFGHAITHGQRIPGAVGLAAPIFDSQGAVVGDICLTIPQQRYNPDNAASLIPALRRCAAQVTHALGGRQPPAPPQDRPGDAG